MGKTTSTVREEMRRIQDEEWQQYRCALRRRNQEAYDAVIEEIEWRAAPIHAANPVDPRTLMLLSAIIGLQRQVDDLQAQLDTEDA